MLWGNTIKCCLLPKKMFLNNCASKKLELWILISITKAHQDGSQQCIHAWILDGGGGLGWGWGQARYMTNYETKMNSQIGSCQLNLRELES